MFSKALIIKNSKSILLTKNKIIYNKKTKSTYKTYLSVIILIFNRNFQTQIDLANNNCKLIVKIILLVIFSKFKKMISNALINKKLF